MVAVHVMVLSMKYESDLICIYWFLMWIFNYDSVNYRWNCNAIAIIFFYYFVLLSNELSLAYVHEPTFFRIDTHWKSIVMIIMRKTITITTKNKSIELHANDDNET